MEPEQKIEGVPKQRILVAEFIVPENACTGIYPVVTAHFHMHDDSGLILESRTQRIEERDV